MTFSGPSITSRQFGILPVGRSVEAWTLQGAGGLTLEAITYGGIVTRLLAPDRHGKLDDVVLGFDSLAAYLAGHPYFGAIIGRVAGRITGAAFDVDQTRYRVVANDHSNHLHGGIEGFDKKLWTASVVSREDRAPSLRLTRTSPEGEEGYPGTVNVSVTYTLAADNSFEIAAEATTDRATPLSLTHHSYFNLGGETAGSVAGHELEICADETVATDQTMTLLDRRVPVAGEANDFNKPRMLGDALPGLFQRHGDLYFIRKTASQRAEHRPVTAARLAHRGSGRTLVVNTSEDYLQLYTGVSIPANTIGKSGQAYVPHAGLCLECQGYPGGTSTRALGDIILRPGQTYRQKTVYLFGTD